MKLAGSASMHARQSDLPHRPSVEIALFEKSGFVSRGTETLTEYIGLEPARRDSGRDKTQSEWGSNTIAMIRVTTSRNATAGPRAGVLNFTDNHLEFSHQPNGNRLHQSTRSSAQRFGALKVQIANR
jgi:hypothetical protein